MNINNDYRIIQESVLEVIYGKSSEKKITEESGKDYKKYFCKILKKYGVSSPDELKGDKRKKFFDEVDAGWDAGENETDVDESKTVVIKKEEDEEEDIPDKFRNSATGVTYEEKSDDESESDNDENKSLDDISDEMNEAILDVYTTKINSFYFK